MKGCGGLGVSRLALINMVIGFAVLFFGGALGTFVAYDLSKIYLSAPEQLHGWQQTIARSVHGHTGLFAFSHVLFALTLPYSRLSARIKFWQTLGICAGTIAMCPLLYLKSFLAPHFISDPLSMLIGALLSAYLFAIACHAFGIFLRIKDKG